MESTNRRRRRQKGYPCNALRLLIRLWGIITSTGKNPKPKHFSTCTFHIHIHICVSSYNLCALYGTDIIAEMFTFIRYFHLLCARFIFFFSSILFFCSLGFFVLCCFVSLLMFLFQCLFCSFCLPLWRVRVFFFCLRCVHVFCSLLTTYSLYLFASQYCFPHDDSNICQVCISHLHRTEILIKQLFKFERFNCERVSRERLRERKAAKERESLIVNCMWKWLVGWLVGWCEYLHLSFSHHKIHTETPAAKWLQNESNRAKAWSLMFECTTFCRWINVQIEQMNGEISKGPNRSMLTGKKPTTTTPEHEPENFYELTRFPWVFDNSTKSSQHHSTRRVLSNVTLTREQKKNAKCKQAWFQRFSRDKSIEDMFQMGYGEKNNYPAIQRFICSTNF